MTKRETPYKCIGMMSDGCVAIFGRFATFGDAMKAAELAEARAHGGEFANDSGRVMLAIVVSIGERVLAGRQYVEQ